MNLPLETNPCPLCNHHEARLLHKVHTMMYDGEDTATFTFVQCSHCDFIYLNPRVPAHAVHHYYPPYYLSYRGPSAWGKYAWLATIGARQELGRRLHMVKRWAPATDQPVRLLDVGCGRPSFLQAVTHTFGWQGTGLDFDSSSWQGTEYQALDLRLGNPSETDFRTLGTYDLITMWHYLEHEYTPAATLRNLLAAATPQTRLVIEVPNYASLTRKWQGNHWEGFHAPRHTGVYTPATLKNMLESHGWKVVAQKPYGSLDPFALWWMGERERKKLPWDQSLEKEFPGFMARKVMLSPLFALEKWVSLGVQVAVAIPA